MLSENEIKIITEKKTIHKIFSTLSLHWLHAKCELIHNNPFLNY